MVKGARTWWPFVALVLAILSVLAGHLVNTVLQLRDDPAFMAIVFCIVFASVVEWVHVSDVHQLLNEHAEHFERLKGRGSHDTRDATEADATLDHANGTTKLSRGARLRKRLATVALPLLLAAGLLKTMVEMAHAKKTVEESQGAAINAASAAESASGQAQRAADEARNAMDASVAASDQASSASTSAGLAAAAASGAASASRWSERRAADSNLNAAKSALAAASAAQFATNAEFAAEGAAKNSTEAEQRAIRAEQAKAATALAESNVKAAERIALDAADAGAASAVQVATEAEAVRRAQISVQKMVEDAQKAADRAEHARDQVLEAGVHQPPTPAAGPEASDTGADASAGDAAPHK